MDGVAPGYGEVKLKTPGSVQVKAKVALTKEVKFRTRLHTETPQGICAMLNWLSKEKL